MDGTVPAGQRPSADDPHRPVYHFLPPANWLNDPNGLIHWQGKYHLFYQHNPSGPVHGRIHWGHACSEDLIHWTHLPVALAPTPGGPDEEGCWSGCAVVDDAGVPTFLYTGVRDGYRRQQACLATSSDDLLSLTKHPGNPIIPGPPAGMEALGFRDHTVWREDDGWYQLIGSGIQGVGGAVLLYRSPDLRQWEYLHPLLVGEHGQSGPLWTGSMWECPDFFPLGDQHTLVFSIWDDQQLHYTAYFVGSYAEHRFTPRTVRMLDFGGRHFYAPQTLLDGQGRRLIWGWLVEGRPVHAQVAAGWSGALSLPRVLTMHPAGVIGMTPAPELAALRGGYVQLADQELAAVGLGGLHDVRGDTLEIQATIELDAATQVALSVRRAPGGEEETRISYDAGSGQLALDRARSSLDPETERTRHEGELRLAPGEPLQLQVFLDRSVIEVFANGRACITSRIYPTRSDSLGLELTGIAGRAYVRRLDVWEMRSIW